MEEEKKEVSRNAKRQKTAEIFHVVLWLGPGSGWVTYPSLFLPTTRIREAIRQSFFSAFYSESRFFF